MVETTTGKSLRMRCPAGLKINEAFLLASLARSCKAMITITHEGLTADAKNLMEILWLGVRSNGMITLTVAGEEVMQALAGLESLYEVAVPPVFARADFSAAAAAAAGDWPLAQDG